MNPMYPQNPGQNPETPMSLQYLLEHAALEALGQLDGAEQATFDRAFAAAPAAVRAQVRAEQARWVALDPLLPAVEPSAELRERVLDAVSAAMLEAQSEAELTLIPARRVSRWWRISSIGLATAVVVLGFAFENVYQGNQSIRAELRAGVIDDSYLSTYGPARMRDAVLDASTRLVHFEARGGFEGKASLQKHPSWQSDVLFTANLPAVEGATYRLVRLDDEGRIAEELSAFEADTKFKSHEIGAALEAGTRIAIVSAVKGARAMAGEILLIATV